MRFAATCVALVSACLALLLVGLLSQVLPAAYPALGITPSPTPGLLTTDPFPFRFAGLPSEVFIGHPVALGVVTQLLPSAKLSVTWSFGDGTSATGVTVQHVYLSPGPYQVTATAVASPGGTALVQTTLYIQSPPTPVSLVLPPGGDETITFTYSCPGLGYVEGIGFITGSCGGGLPRSGTIVNDGDQPLSVTYDRASETVLLAAPTGYAVVTADIPQCAPVSPDRPNAISCSVPYPPRNPGGSSSPLRVTIVAAGTYPVTVTYPAGWNLVAGIRVPDAVAIYPPQGGGPALPVPAGTVLSAQQGFAPGVWAYFAHSTTAVLAARGEVDGSVLLQAGTWTLIGNPGQVLVSVEGVDAVEVYDPGSNAYAAVTELQPGQGAWAFSTLGGTVTFMPSQP